MPTREEVRAVARLARLSFTDAELEHMTGDLRDMLALAQELRTIAAPPAAGVADAASAAGENADADYDAVALRPDVPGADPLALPPSYLAPDWRDGFFAVPRLPAHDRDTR